MAYDLFFQSISIECTFVQEQFEAFLKRQCRFFDLGGREFLFRVHII